MWILSLEWLLLVLLVFWVTGAWKRLKRLRVASKTAFLAVDTQFLHVLEMLRSSASSQDDAAEKREAQASSVHARNALLPCANLLEAALQQAKQHPMRPETIAALDSAWQGVQVAWLAYTQLSTGSSEVPDEAPTETEQRWSQLVTLQNHSAEQFNASVRDYNRAITQFPACVIARLSGHQPARAFQKDAALLMQPPA